MKAKLLALLAALSIVAGIGIAGQVPAHAWASGWNNSYWGSSGFDAPGYPYYGSHLASADFYYDGHNSVNNEIDVNAGTGADYSHYPTTWGYTNNPPGPDHLEARVWLQYDNNGDGVSDGNCGTMGTANVDGAYSTPAAWKGWTLNMCDHARIRPVTRHSYDYNIGGWHEFWLYGDWIAWP